MTIDSQMKNFISKSDKNVRTKTKTSCKPTEYLVQTLYERGKNRNNVVTSYRVLQQLCKNVARTWWGRNKIFIDVLLTQLKRSNNAVWTPQWGHGLSKRSHWVCGRFIVRQCRSHWVLTTSLRFLVRAQLVLTEFYSEPGGNLMPLRLFWTCPK